VTATEQVGADLRIVVGVDGSEHSKEAMRWALRQAALIGSSVDAIMAWQYPAAPGKYAWAIPPMAEIEESAGKQLDDLLAAVVDPAGTVRVTPRVEEGNAAQVLLDAAAGAELLVVGSHGHGGFAGAALGSVSLHCSHHSPCPLVIVRGQWAAASEGDETARNMQGAVR